jgi:hypothetical protein
LTRLDDLYFALDRILWDEEAGELAIVYTRHARGSVKRVVETFRFGADGQVLATEVLHGIVPG